MAKQEFNLEEFNDMFDGNLDKELNDFIQERDDNYDRSEDIRPDPKNKTKLSTSEINELFNAETQRRAKEAIDAGKQIKANILNNEASYVDRLTLSRKHNRLSKDYIGGRYGDILGGDLGIGSVLKGAKKSKQQILDEATNSFAYFVSGSDYPSFNAAFKAFRKDEIASMPLIKSNIVDLRKNFERAYSVIADYRNNDDYIGKVQATALQSAVGSTNVVAKMVKLDSNKYLMPTKHMPLLNGYDPAIGAMFRLFNDINNLEIVVSSTGAKLSFERTEDGYKLAGGTGAILSDYRGTNYNLPSYKQNDGKVFIPETYSLERAIGTARDDFSLGNGLGFTVSKGYFDRMVHGQRSMKARALHVYRSYAKRVLGTSNLSSLQGVLNTPIKDLKNKIKVDADLKAKDLPYSRLEYSAIGQELMDALEYTGADRSTLKDLYKDKKGKEFLAEVQTFTEHKAVVEARKKVMNKVTDIYMRHGHANKLPMGAFDYLMESVNKTLIDGVPTDRTFKVLNNADDFLDSFTKTEIDPDTGSITKRIAKQKMINFLITTRGVDLSNFNSFITSKDGQFDPDNVTNFLDAEGHLKVEYLEHMVKKGFLGKSFLNYNPNVMSVVKDYISPYHIQALEERGPFFSTNALKELAEDHPYRFAVLDEDGEPAGKKPRPSARVFSGMAKKRKGSFDKFLKDIIPYGEAGIGLVSEGWATRGHLGDAYLMEQLASSNNSDDFLDDYEIRQMYYTNLVDQAEHYDLSNRQVAAQGKDLGLYNELEFESDRPTGKYDPISALNNEIAPLLDKAVNGRIRPETLEKYFVTRQHGLGTKPSIIQELWAKHKTLTPKELAIVQKLARATGFVSRGTALFGNKEVVRLFNDHLLPLQTEINESRAQRTVGFLGQDTMIESEAVKAAYEGRALKVGEVNNQETFTGLDQNHNVNKGLSYRTGQDGTVRDALAAYASKAKHAERVKKGRMVVAPAADQVDFYKAISGFSRALFGSKFSGLNNYWDDNIKNLLTSPDGIILPKNNRLYGNTYSARERKILSQAHKYIATTRGLPGDIVDSPFGGWDTLAEFDYTKITSLTPDRKMALQDTFVESFKSLQSVLLDDTEVFPIVSDITEKNPIQRENNKQVKTTDKLTDTTEILKDAHRQKFSPGLDSLENLADIESRFAVAGYKPNELEFKADSNEFNLALQHLGKAIADDKYGSGVVTKTAKDAYSSLESQYLNITKDGFTEDNGFALKGLLSLLNIDTSKKLHGKILRKLDPKQQVKTLASIIDTKGLIKLGKQKIKESYKSAQFTPNKNKDIYNTVASLNNIPFNPNIDSTIKSVNQKVAIKKLILDGSRLETKQHSGLSFSLVKPESQVIKKNFSTNSFLDKVYTSIDHFTNLDKLNSYRLRQDILKGLQPHEYREPITDILAFRADSLNIPKKALEEGKLLIDALEHNIPTAIEEIKSRKVFGDDFMSNPVFLEHARKFLPYGKYFSPTLQSTGFDFGAKIKPISKLSDKAPKGTLDNRLRTMVGTPYTNFDNLLVELTEASSKASNPSKYTAAINEVNSILEDASNDIFRRANIPELKADTEDIITKPKSRSKKQSKYPDLRPFNKYIDIVPTDPSIDTDYNEELRLIKELELKEDSALKVSLNKASDPETKANATRAAESLSRVLSIKGLESLDKRSPGRKLEILRKLFKIIPKFARGGHLPGRSVKDEIPALLMKGETVLTQSTSEALGIRNHADYKRFEKAAEEGKVRGFIDGDSLGDKNKSKRKTNKEYTWEEAAAAVEEATRLGNLGGDTLIDKASEEQKKAYYDKLDKDNKLRLSLKLDTVGIEELRTLGVTDNDYKNNIASIIDQASTDAGKKEFKGDLNSRLGKLLKDKEFILSLPKSEAKNLLKASAFLQLDNKSSVKSFENIIESVLTRHEGSKEPFSNKVLNQFSGLSPYESIKLTNMLGNNGLTSSNYSELASQSKVFANARAWYEENGLAKKGKSFNIPESSLFTTGADIGETTKLLKDLYKQQKLSADLGFDTAKMMEGIVGTDNGKVSEGDFVKHYINNKDRLVSNILEPFRNNKNVVQTVISRLTDEQTVRAANIATGTARLESDIDPDNIGAKVKSDGIVDSANAARGFRNSAITRWANFKDQMTQNAAFMAGYGALSIPIGATAATFGGAIEFEDSLKNLQAITGSSTEQLNSMTKAIKHVAVNTKFSAKEIAGAATTLGQAGFTAAEINSSLGGIVKLATATGSSLEDSTQTLTSALTVWDRPLSDSDSMANEMTAAINKSKLDMGAITSSIQYAGNIAAQGGIPMTDLLTMTSLMKDAGIKQPSTIATGSRLVYSDFMAPSKKFAKSLKEASISLDDFQSTFDKGGIVETVKFLKKSGYGFTEASKGMEVRERVAYMAMVNQIDKADVFRASITGTQAAETANAVQMSSGINSFKNMFNSWQTEMFDASENFLKASSAIARVFTVDGKKPNVNMFKDNEDLAINTENWIDPSVTKTMLGVGTAGAMYAIAHKFGSKDPLASTALSKLFGADKPVSKLGGALKSTGTLALGALSSPKVMGYGGMALNGVIDGASEYNETKDVGQGLISGIAGTLKSIGPGLAAIEGAKIGATINPVIGSIGGFILGGLAGTLIQSGLGIDNFIDKSAESVKTYKYGKKGSNYIDAVNARSEEQASFIQDLSKTLKYVKDDKSSIIQDSDKEKTTNTKKDNEQAKISRDSKELVAYNKAIELDRLHVDKLVLLDKPMSFTDGVYDAYNTSDGKTSANEVLVSNIEKITKASAKQSAEMQLKEFSKLSSGVVNKDIVDKIDTEEGLKAFLTSEGFKSVDQLASKSPLAYLANIDKIIKYVEDSVRKTYAHKGFGEELVDIDPMTGNPIYSSDKAVSDTANKINRKGMMASESANLSGQTKDQLLEMINIANTSPKITPESRDKIIRNAKNELGNIKLEESGYNRLKEKISDYRSSMTEINKATFEFLSDTTDKVNDFSKNAIKQVGVDGFDVAKEFSKTISNASDQFNLGNTNALLSSYLSPEGLDALVKQNKDAFVSNNRNLGRMAKPNENNIQKAVINLENSGLGTGADKNKVESIGSIIASSVSDITITGDDIAKGNLAVATEGSISEKYANALITISEAADSFAKNKLLTGDKSKAIANGDLVDYQFSKALDQAFVSRGVNLDSISSLLNTDIASLKPSDRGSLASLFDSNFNKKLDFKKQTAIEDIDYNTGLQIQHAYSSKAFNDQINDLQFAFKNASIERSRQHNIEESSINYGYQIDSIGRQRNNAIEGAGRNLAQNLYQIGVNFERNMYKLNVDNSRNLEKLATDIFRATEKIELDKERSLQQVQLNYSRGLQDLGTSRSRNLEDANTNLARSLEDLNKSIERSKSNLNLDVSRSTSDANLSFTRQVASIQQAMQDTAYMFERSMSKPVNIQLDPESLLKVADNLNNLSLAMDAHKASLESNTSAVKEYMGINKTKEDLVKGAYLEAYKSSGGDVNSESFKTAYQEYMKSHGSELVDTVVGFGLDTAMAGQGFDATRALYDPTYIAGQVANPSSPVDTEEAVTNSGLTPEQITQGLLGDGQGQFTIQTTQGVVLEAKGEMEGTLFDLQTQMINFGFNLRDAATSLEYALTDIGTSYGRAIEDLTLAEQQQLEDINLSFVRNLEDIELSYSRGLEDLNLGLQRSFEDITIQYQYALEDLRISQAQSMADLQLAFSQALTDLQLSNQWQQQDAVSAFAFALQDIEASYRTALTEAAIDHQRQIEAINREAMWQLSESFINNEQNKQIMELQFQELLRNINISSEEAKANLDRQIGESLANLVLDLQGMKDSLESQFRNSFGTTVFDMSLAMSKMQEGIDRAAADAEINLEELRNKLEVSFRALGNDEKIKEAIKTIGVTFKELTDLVTGDTGKLDEALKAWEGKIKDNALQTDLVGQAVQQSTINATMTDQLLQSLASTHTSMSTTYQSLADSTNDSMSSVISVMSDVVSSSSSIQSDSWASGQLIYSGVQSLASYMESVRQQAEAIANQAASSGSWGGDWGGGGYGDGWGDDPTFYSTGGVLAGYGGGDTVRAMLEPGEAVITKEVVRALGPDFINKLNSSPSTFAQGLFSSDLGLVNNLTQSTNNVSSGYNINIQVAPDASLSTIERNIDKIANGVRQVFEEYL